MYVLNEANVKIYLTNETVNANRITAELAHRDNTAVNLNNHDEKLNFIEHLIIQNKMKKGKYLCYYTKGVFLCSVKNYHKAINTLNLSVSYEENISLRKNCYLCLAIAHFYSNNLAKAREFLQMAMNVRHFFRNIQQQQQVLHIYRVILLGLINYFMVIFV